MIKPWKSREGIEPPPQFFADVIAYLRRAYPGASLGRDVIVRLRPHLVGQWRIGQSAPKAAAATCSCDGQSITPSPPSLVDLPRRAARPPKGAGPNQVFGIEEVREAGRLPKLRMQAEVATRQVEHYQAERLALALELMAATENGKEGRRVARRLMKAEKELESNQVRLAELRSEIAELAPAAIFPVPPVPASPVAELAAPAKAPPRAKQQKTSKKASAPKAAPAAAKTSVPPKRKTSPCSTCQTPAPSPEPLPTDDQAELARLVNEFAQAEVDELEGGGG